jgi:DUF438 domain-containing protein
MSKDISKEWDYRVVRQTSEDGDEWLSVQEMYYDDETNKPMAHTMDLQIEGDTIAGMRTQLQRMLWCLDKEIIDEIENDIMEDNIEGRLLTLEMENAEMKDRLIELGEMINKKEKNSTKMGEGLEIDGMYTDDEVEEWDKVMKDSKERGL